jgi:hypothetical protein
MVGSDMNEAATGLCLLLVLLVCIAEVFHIPKPGPWTPKRAKCEKDASKPCPSRWRVTAAGGFESDIATMMQCCKVRAQLAAVARLSKRV